MKWNIRQWKMYAMACWLVRLKIKLQITFVRLSVSVRTFGGESWPVVKIVFFFPLNIAGKQLWPSAFRLRCSALCVYFPFCSSEIRLGADEPNDEQHRRRVSTQSVFALERESWVPDKRERKGGNKEDWESGDKGQGGKETLNCRRALSAIVTMHCIMKTNSRAFMYIASYTFLYTFIADQKNEIKLQTTWWDFLLMMMHKLCSRLHVGDLWKFPGEPRWTELQSTAVWNNME